MAFDGEQRAIARNAAAGLAITVIMLVVAGNLSAFEASDTDARINVLCLTLAAPIIALFRDIGRLGNHRFAEPLDRNAAAAETKTAKADMLSAILRNTHEQATVAALVYAIAAFTLPAHWTDAIIGCALLFLIGRLVFAAGYAKGAGGRAFGFALTFYPTMALAVLTAITALI